MTDISKSKVRSSLFHGLADRSRLAILSALSEQELRVSDIVEATGLTQSNVSGHLSCLWECSLVSRRRHGREIHYRLVPGVADLLKAADTVLERAGATFGAYSRCGAKSNA